MLRMMFIVMLVVLALPVLAETTADSDRYDTGDSWTYVYMLFSGADEDIITSFHIYAPMDRNLVTDWTADEGWGFEALVDEETGGADLWWYSLTGVASGLDAGGMLMVSITTPKSVVTNEEYTLPGCFGNWGYEVAGWAGSVAIMPSSVMVPQSKAVITPEPSSVMALLTGLGAVVAMRRRRG